MSKYTKQTIINAEEALKKARRTINWERIDQIKKDLLKSRYSTAVLLAPSIFEWEKSIKQVACHLPDLIEQMDVDAKKVRQIADVQMKWLRQIAYLSTYETKSLEPKKSKGIELIATDGNYVLFVNKLTKVRESNSVHKLILDALLYRSDENGFLSYQDIDEYLVKNGKKRLETMFKRRKRITDSYSDIHRFLGVPKSFKGKEIIVLKRGKGLQLNSSMDFVD